MKVFTSPSSVPTTQIEALLRSEMLIKNVTSFSSDKSQNQAPQAPMEIAHSTLSRGRCGDWYRHYATSVELCCDTWTRSCGYARRRRHGVTKLTTTHLNTTRASLLRSVHCYLYSGQPQIGLQHPRFFLCCLPWKPRRWLSRRTGPHYCDRSPLGETWVAYDWSQGMCSADFTTLPLSFLLI